MLELLHIENIAVIEETEIEFRAGFNALTGETGAGKSIVIDALGAVLGGRTSRDLIRTGTAKALVSASFTDAPPDLPDGVSPDEDGLLLLQRELSAEGKNTCRINGRPVSVAQLRRVGQELVNIHGQRDGQQLLDEARHGEYLDRFGKTSETLSAYRRDYDAMSALRTQINALRMDEAERARRLDSLRYQIDELERAELVPGEEETLTARRNLLRNAEKYLSALSRADGLLNGDDETAGAVSQLQEAENALYSVRSLDDELGELFRRLEAVRCEALDIAESVRDKRFAFDFSPEELDAAESRADLLYRLEKKYGSTVEDMISYLEQRRAEFEAIETADDTLARLQADYDAAKKAVKESGARLTAVRREAAKELEARILRELKDLDMKNMRFSIDFQAKAPSPDGCDAIRFLMSANVGEEPRPIARIASGGELARIMLALKNVLAEEETVSTLVFDEVDTGVSGRAAQRIAEKLAQVSRHKQVLCVTHLPQLAAMADTHFSVEKNTRDGRTFTEARTLDREARKRELARITGGNQVTETLLNSAGELLDEAKRYRASLRTEA